MPTTAKAFVEELKKNQSDAERAKIGKYFKGDDKENQVIGVRMKTTFDLAKESKDMSLDEVEKLLDEPYYEARMGAMSIMDFKARTKKITEQERKALYDLYMNRHERINNWDSVDRAAPRVVGWYLMDKPRDILYKLARSKDIWERRTATGLPGPGLPRDAIGATARTTSPAQAEKGLQDKQVHALYEYDPRRPDWPARESRGGCCGSWTGIGHVG
jgi:hypothetical protein